VTEELSDKIERDDVHVVVDSFYGQVHLEKLRSALVKLDERFASVTIDTADVQEPCLVLSEAEVQMLVDKLDWVRLALRDVGNLIDVFGRLKVMR
jgi:hypothetical protein